MKIIWCMIPEIWNATDRNFSHFGPSFTFPPTPSVTTPENKNLKKMKKTPGYLIILHKCTINDNHTIYGSWDMKCNRIFFAILGHFLPFYPTNRPKKENIKKMKKNAWKYHFTPSVPNIMITGYPVPEIWLVTDVIIFHFELYFSLLPCNKNFKKKWSKHQRLLKKNIPKIMICFTVLEVWHLTDVILIFHFGLFLPFSPPQQPKKWKFHKNEKTPVDIIILHKCSKNHDMLYCSWDMTCDRCNCYFLFWASFCPFTPLTAQKMKISKKLKKTPGDIIILHMCTKNYD